MNKVIIQGICKVFYKYLRGSYEFVLTRKFLRVQWDATGNINNYVGTASINQDIW